jgi:palmitoyltransferase ZDHHC2/15/20
VLVRYHLVILKEPLTFTIHLLVSYILTFLAFSSLIVCVVRDPGPVNFSAGSPDETEELGITQALMSADDDYSAPGRWCRKCWVSKINLPAIAILLSQAPKYERTHHCTTCGRCVLKMGEYPRPSVYHVYLT